MVREIVIAEAEFDIGSGTKMRLVLYKPRQDASRREWACRFKFTKPLDVDKIVFGENSLQSLLLAIKLASTYLYSSDLYKKAQIGIFGRFGGKLILPAPSALLDIAPFPF